MNCDSIISRFSFPGIFHCVIIGEAMWYIIYNKYVITWCVFTNYLLRFTNMLVAKTLLRQTAYEDLTICSSHSNDGTLSPILQMHYGPFLRTHQSQFNCRSEYFRIHSEGCWVNIARHVAYQLQRRKRARGRWLILSVELSCKLRVHKSSDVCIKLCWKKNHRNFHVVLVILLLLKNFNVISFPCL